MSLRSLRPALALALAVFGFTAPARVAANEPANLDLRKQELKTYVDSGEYDREIARVAADASAWLEQRAARGGSKLAAIFDIDETLLSNLSHIRMMDYGYQPRMWAEWVQLGKAPAIKPVCDLLRTALKLNIAVFIISGRTGQDRPATEKNLRAAGVVGYTALSFKGRDNDDTTEAFKTAERKLLAADGYTIILNIGDQESDLAGGYAEKTFKLPNPFYFTK